MTKFKELTDSQVEFIKDCIKNTPEGGMAETEAVLSEKFGVSDRTIRRWRRKVFSLDKTGAKILVYDLETSRATAKVFWTGKQYVGYKSIVEQPRIISVSWSWVGEDKVHSLVWDENQSDKSLVEDFVTNQYNKADLVIGYNQNNFDNRWLNAQAIEYGVYINTHVRSLDLYKEEKRLARQLSYSMDFSAKKYDVEYKQSHEGLVMWDKIEDGTKAEQKEYFQKLVDYNVGDIVTTEALYFRLLPYIKHQSHLGVLKGRKKFSCPVCGGYNVELFKITTTAAGTKQFVMRCKDDGATFKINGKQYAEFVEQVVNA